MIQKLITSFVAFLKGKKYFECIGVEVQLHNCGYVRTLNGNI